MLFEPFFYASLITLAVSFAAALLGAPLLRRTRISISPYHVLVVGTLFSATLFFLPISLSLLGGGSSASTLLSAILGSLYNTIRLFAIDGDYFDVMNTVEAFCPELLSQYRVLGVFLHGIPPLLTFGFILSFVKNASASVRYFFSPFQTAHIFSELNERSLALATSIVNEDRARHHFLPRALVVFTDLVDKEDEVHYDLADAAARLGAIFFRKDLASIHFGARLSTRPRRFYLIGDNEEEKLRHAAAIMREYDTKKTSLFIFSDSKQSELLFTCDLKRKGKHPSDMARVVRVNDIQELVYHNLDRYGVRLFQTARRYHENEIHSVIIGLGRYGREMLKALSWYGQIPGFSLRITAFERDENAAAGMRLSCPELFAMSGSTKEGEAHYTIDIQSGIDVGSEAFWQRLDACGTPTHIFVSLGNDEDNITVATALRAHMESKDLPFMPDIEAVVYNSDVAGSMGMSWHTEIEGKDEEDKVDGIKKKGRGYRLHMVGDLDSFYSVDTLLDSYLADAGLRVHLRYSTADREAHRILDEAGRYAAREEAARGTEAACRLRFLRRRTAEEREERRAQRTIARRVAELEQDFGASYWMVEYNYRSSISKALHERLREKLEEIGYLSLPGVNTPWGERSEEEKLAIGRVEHIRWNAYMRSEGYCYAPVRNELAKEHPLLCPLGEIRDDDLRKDA